MSQTLTGSQNRSVQCRTYTYRAGGHVTAVDDQLAGSRRYELDSVGRVTAVHAADWTERYACDEMGNQAKASWPEKPSGRGSHR